MKTHYNKSKKSGEITPACGAEGITTYGADTRATKERGAVTCLRCKRTREFKGKGR
jgi:hypothetical protein